MIDGARSSTQHCTVIERAIERVAERVAVSEPDATHAFPDGDSHPHVLDEYLHVLDEYMQALEEYLHVLDELGGPNLVRVACRTHGTSNRCSDE